MRCALILSMVLLATAGACSKKKAQPTTPSTVREDRPRKGSADSQVMDVDIDATVKDGAAAPAAAEPIYFDFDSAALKPESRETLARLADYLEKNPRATVTITGHTDERGTTEYNVALLEDPCKLTTIDRMAELARQLPIAILGDGISSSLEAAHAVIKANAVGAVNVKLARTGITESLKIFALCEAAGLPNIIGTDTETRIGALARIHVRAALPWLEPYPCETQFFERLTDDCFAGEFEFKDGRVTVPNTPGFGVAIDEKKLKQYQV